jgi:hypothetical protein
MTIASQTRRLLLRSIKAHPSLYEFLRYRLYARFRSVKREQIFRKIYQTNYWGNDFSVSGPGSSLKSTENLRKTLPLLVAAVGARSFLDIPCGDFQWMKHVPLGVERYYGADIVFSLVESNQKTFGDRGNFLRLDLLRDKLPSVDIVFCRDCLIHLSFREINLAINNIRNAAPRYIFTTTFPDHQANVDTVTPYWRPLNLQLAPFNFPAPIYLIKDCSDSEYDYQGKCLGIWRVQDLDSSQSTPFRPLKNQEANKQNNTLEL